MDENDKTVLDSGQAAPDMGQPASEAASQETLDTTAASEPSESQPAGPEDTSAAPAVDDELQKFARSQGIELDSPNAIKAAQALQKSRSEATRNYQKASELEKGMTQMGDVAAENVAQATGQDPELLKRVQRMEIRDSIRDFYSRNPDAPQYEDRMNEIAQTAGLYGTPDAILRAAYAMAKSEDSSATAAVASQASKDTLERLAHKQQAAVPTGHATTQTAPKEKPFSELSIQEMEQKLGKVRR